MKRALAALVIALSLGSATQADTVGEVRKVYDQFAAAQNAHDLARSDHS